MVCTHPVEILASPLIHSCACGKHFFLEREKTVTDPKCILSFRVSDQSLVMFLYTNGKASATQIHWWTGYTVQTIF